ncbi:Rieske family iron-sulfur cluster-binding protein [Alcanivorax xiamenensis]|uniref:Rieske family iron-sulfur cluster-binding protein n=2 Tax=Alcanivorax xiamenensis TaxID=1177156 RepID=A0ABQ6YAG0_9GAMM|nr:Rieske family iron-sulfur cluster-binding protein [Alcanivorax xiamenensis]
MNVMEHAVFRCFWYPVIPMSELKQGPRRFELLGQALALFLDDDGVPAALEDRCCHRTARLSLGEVCDNAIACPYHGWRYNRDGQCVLVPQMPDRDPGPKRRVKAFSCREKYGYAWVALEEPLFDIPDFPEAADDRFVLIHEFYEEWRVSGLRVMENELDMAHPSYVHLGTFGSPEHLVAEDAKIEEFPGGFHYTGRLGVKQAHHAQDRNNERFLDCSWYAPFICRLRINYADGPAHVIINCQVPLADNRSQVVQFCFQEDDGAGIDEAAILAFDRKVTLEDKHVLESTDADVPLDPRDERHMVSDKPGLVMRRMIQSLIEDHETQAVAVQ